MGFEFLYWTSAGKNAEALGFRALCGLAGRTAISGPTKVPFKWQDAWNGIILGPLMEEALFRGCLFGLAELGLRNEFPAQAELRVLR